MSTIRGRISVAQGVGAIILPWKSIEVISVTESSKAASAALFRFV